MHLFYFVALLDINANYSKTFKSSKSKSKSKNKSNAGTELIQSSIKFAEIFYQLSSHLLVYL